MQMKILILTIAILQIRLSLTISSQTTINFLGLLYIDSQNIFSIKSSSSSSGPRIYSIGDINGDGISDLFVVVPSESLAQIYVLYGKRESLGNFVIPSFNDYTSFHGFKIYLDLSDTSGLRSISSFGDFNDDGINDIVILTGMDSELKAIMIYGKDREDNELIRESELTKTDGFKMSATRQNNYGVTSYRVMRTGDINSDGIDDGMILIQQQENTYPNRFKIGMLYTVYGNGSFSDNINLDTSSSKFRIYETDPTVMLPIEWIGDINHDGLDDFAGVSSDKRQLYVIYGRTGGLTDMNITNIPNSQGFRISGGTYQIGYSYSSAGDINCDGIDDLIVAEETYYDYNPVYVIYGKISGFSDIDLTKFGPSDGFKITDSAWNEGLGAPFTSVGDINNDGFDDLLITSNVNSEKRVYIIFGQKDRRPDIDIAAAENLLMFKANVAKYGTFDAIKVGDLNGDGIDDIAFKTSITVYGIYGSDCNNYLDCSSPMPTICYASRGCVCRNKQTMIQGLSCVSSCSAGYYQASNSTCKICSENCKVCSNDSVCEACFDGFVLQNSVCKSSCSGGYLAQESFCVSSCSEGYLLQGSLCLSSCSDGYLRQDSLCVSSCLNGYLTQDSLCVSSCSEGYIRQDSLCMRPRLDDNVILDSSYMSSCSGGYVMFRSSCLSIGVIIGATAGAVAALVIAITAIIYVRRRLKRTRGNNTRIPFPLVTLESEMAIRLPSSPSYLGKDSYLEQPIENVQNNNNNDCISIYAVGEREEEKENSKEAEVMDLQDIQAEYEARAKKAA